MKLILLFLSVFIVFTVTSSKKSYKITFPEGDTLFYAKLLGTIDRPLTDLTLCHWSKTNAYNPKFGAVFTYSTVNDMNAFLTFIKHNEVVQFQRNGERLYKETKTKVKTSHWLHTCITWTVVESCWQIFVNGEKLANGTGPEFPPVQPNGVVILGQEQDEMGGGFDINQALVGEVSELHLWDYVFTPKEVIQVSNCEYPEGGNVINWNQATWALYNGARISAVRLPCGQPQ